MAKKTPCPISRDQFRTHAIPVIVKIGDEEMEAEVKEFSTGSLGWYLNTKTKIPVGDTKVSVQIGMNLTIVGSKDLPKDEVAEPVTSAATAPATPTPNYSTDSTDD